MTSRDPTIASDGSTWQVGTPLHKLADLSDKSVSDLSHNITQVFITHMTCNSQQLAITKIGDKYKNYLTSMKINLLSKKDPKHKYLGLDDK
jgi:hypothetical protein